MLRELSANSRGSLDRRQSQGSSSRLDSRRHKRGGSSSSLARRRAHRSSSSRSGGSLHRSRRRRRRSTRGGAADRNLRVQHTAAVGADIYLPSDVCGTGDLAGGHGDGTKALRTLNVSPSSTSVGASVQLVAVGAGAKGVQVPRARSGADAEGDGLCVGESAELGEGDAKVDRAEDAHVRADVQLAGDGGVGDDVADGLGGSQGVRDGGEGGASVGAAVEGARGRAGVENGVVALVGGNDSARWERGDGGEGALVLRADDAGGARRPNDGRRRQSRRPCRCS